MNSFIANLDRLRQASGATALILHHTNKAGLSNAAPPPCAVRPT
jgi:hypothetical protein